MTSKRSLQQSRNDDDLLVSSPSVWWVGGGVEYHRCGNKGSSDSDSSGGEDSFSALEATNLAFRFSLVSSSSADVVREALEMSG